MITSLDQLDLKKQYTYADYLQWRFKERVELIHGWIHKMSPAPRMQHQRIQSNLHGLIWNTLRENSCLVFNAPFDVRLLKSSDTSAEKIQTVVQPDICVICDESKLDDAGCLGAPDLIVEILSPSTAKKDYNEKFNLYEENGVQEYWIVHPADKAIAVFSLKDGEYQETTDLVLDQREVSSSLFSEIKLSTEDIFK
jgi:Uma2 family endonuclease